MYFAQTFGDNAAKLLTATGWVTYVVDSDLCFKRFLAIGTSKAEHQEYEHHFTTLDPLAPRYCLANGQEVAILHEEISAATDDHLNYQSNFLNRHRIVDALEIFIQPDKEMIFGCSLLRHEKSPSFSHDDLAKAKALRAIGIFAISRNFSTNRTSPETISMRFPELTKREATLVKLVSEGLNNKQVCQKLNISLPTAKTHLLNVFRKMSIGSRTELVAKVLSGH